MGLNVWCGITYIGSTIIGSQVINFLQNELQGVGWTKFRDSN